MIMRENSEGRRSRKDGDNHQELRSDDIHQHCVTEKRDTGNILHPNRIGMTHL